MLETFCSNYCTKSLDDDTDYDVQEINQCLCLPKAEFNTKNEPKGFHGAVWVRFWCSARFTKKSSGGQERSYSFLFKYPNGLKSNRALFEKQQNQPQSSIF